MAFLELIWRTGSWIEDTRKGKRMVMMVVNSGESDELIFGGSIRKDINGQCFLIWLLLLLLLLLLRWME
jgi:hypothetical protein